MQTNRPINVTIHSTQTESAGAKRHVTRSHATGWWRKTGDEIILLFEERAPESASESTLGQTTIRINTFGEVRLDRETSIVTGMTFVPGGRQLLDLDLEYGTMEVMILTLDVTHESDVAGGRLKLAYMINYLNDQQIKFEVLIDYHFQMTR
ncbi:MAG: DUF1934 family protein [Fastidiosipilaceae bacterium]